ncbi:MAG: glycosyltransferase family 2 protein [Bacteroidetes bacterium]|nr:glycosyltransferase family 2 protein [Bacteroidota bacterium]
MQQQLPEISILMPVFNMSGFLQECIHSIQMQQNVSWELIAVDDFSDDESLKLLENFAASDSRIRVLRNTDKGIIAALTLAFSHSRGTYITRMDADDVMPEHKLTTLKQIAVSDALKVATGNVSYFSAAPVSPGYIRYQNWLNEVAARGTFSENMYRECVIASPNWMVHRSCFEQKIDLNKLRYPEDYDLVFQWYKNGYAFESSANVTHLWREHAGRTSRNSEIYQQKSFFKLKTHYFIDLELSNNQPVQLIGAGIKGKLVAAILHERAIPFHWFTYGHAAEKKRLKPVSELSGTYKTILTNWPTSTAVQSEITAFLAEKKLVPGKNLWLF